MRGKKLDLTRFAPTNVGALSALDICNSEFHPMKWLIGGIIPLEGVTMVVSPPKIGKSIFALNIVVDNCSGVPVLGKYTPQGGFDILYIDLEGTPRRTKDRFMSVLGNRPIPQNIFFKYRWKPLNDGGLHDLYDYADYHPENKLFVIDTMARFQQSSESKSNYSYRDDIRDIALFNTFCQETGASIVLIHHTRKSGGEDWIDEVSGTYGLSGSVDTLVLLKRDRGARQTRMFVTGRDVEETAYLLDINLARYKVTMVGALNPASHDYTDTQLEIVSLLQSHEEPMSPREIAAVLGKTVGSVKRLLLNMMDEGKVLRAGYGKYVDRMK